MKDRFQRVIQEHGPAITRIASSYVKTTAERDDLLQDVMLAIWKALPTFRGEASLRTFIFRIVHNRAMDHVWKRRRRRAAHPDDALYDQIPSTAIGPEALVAGSQTGRRLIAAVRALPLGQRQAITLHLEGLSHSEIADVLGVTENNVAVRIHRSRNSLRAALETIDE